MTMVDPKPETTWYKPCEICHIVTEYQDGISLKACLRESPTTLETLDNSRKNGCIMCGILWDAYAGTLGADHFPKNTKFCLSINDGLTMMNFIPDGDVKCVRLYMGDLEPPYSPWRAIQKPIMPTGTSTNSIETHKWILHKLDDCVRNHRGSCETPSPTFLPTRVIDVSYKQDKVRIITTSGLDGRYLALSHCWGDSGLMSTKLTAHNFKEYTNQGISIDSLPKTFRDAVEVTRKLEVRYLWIDSLCVLQADMDRDLERHSKLVSEDWERESATMCTIFAGSYLTLGALFASNCQQGLFSHLKATEVKGSTPDGMTYNLYAIEDIFHYLDRFPLLSRAWVYQETLVSPRSLYFGDQELIWLCRARGRQGCQCGDANPSSERTVWNSDAPFFKLPSRGTEFDPVNNINDLFPVQQWHLLIERYAQTDITFDGDRLTAIEGLADYMRYWRADEQYFGGIWSGTFVSDLLWIMDGPSADSNAEYLRLRRGVFRRPDGYNKRLQVGPGTVRTKWSSDKWLLPTWSWASLSNRTTNAVVKHLSFCYIIRDSLGIFVRRERYPDDAFLARAISKPFVGNGTSNGQEVTDLAQSRPPYELCIEGTIFRVTRDQLYGRFYCDYLNFSKWYEGQLADPDASTPMLYCLRMVKEYSRFDALVLVCVDEAKQVYERLGVLSQEPDPRNADKQADSPEWWNPSDPEAKPEVKIITLV